MNLPLVSVIIPTYKRPERLPKTIDSVLNQTYKNIEIIVVDDNGIDTLCQVETKNTLSKYIESKLIKYYAHETNKNGAAARNTGLSLAKGEYINFLDDDDTFLANKIEFQVDKIKNTTDKIGAVYCNSKCISIQKITNRRICRNTNITVEGDLCVPYLLEQIRFNTSTILFKSSCLHSLKGFDEKFYRHQDFEIMTRFFMNYEIICTGNEPLLIYDMTHDRMNVPNAEKDYAIKNLFLTTYEYNLRKKKCYNKIAYHMWNNNACLALYTTNYPLFFKSIRNVICLNTFSFKYILKLFLNLIGGIVNSIYNAHNFKK